MTKRMKVKPSKFGSALGFFGGLIFCGLGIYMLIEDINIVSLLFTLIAVLLTVFYGINLFTKKGLSMYSVTIEEDTPKKKNN